MITPKTLEIITAGHAPHAIGRIGTPSQRKAGMQHCTITFTNPQGKTGTIVIGVSESSPDNLSEFLASQRESTPSPGTCDTFEGWKIGYYCFRANADFSAGQVVENRKVQIFWFKGAPRLTTAQVRALMRDVDEHIQAAR